MSFPMNHNSFGHSFWDDWYDDEPMSLEEQEEIMRQGVADYIRWQQEQEELYNQMFFGVDLSTGNHIGNYIVIESKHVPFVVVPLSEFDLNSQTITSGTFWGLIRSNISKIRTIKVGHNQPVYLKIILEDDTYHYKISCVEYLRFFELCEEYNLSIKKDSEWHKWGF